MSDRRNTPAREAPRKRASRTSRSASGGWLAAVLGFGVATAGGAAALWGSGCDGDGETDAAEGETRSRVSAPEQQAVSTATTTADAAASASAAPSGSAEAPPAAAPTVDVANWKGAWLGAMAFQTPVYPEMRFSNERIGYLRQGAKVPVEDAKPTKRSNCKQGWYKLAQGGFVCGKYASTDVDQPRVKLGVKAPDLDAILPYKYAYNRFHGTPLYRKPPTREEMERYEPHIAEERAKKAKKAADKEAAKEAAKAEKRAAEVARQEEAAASAAASASAAPSAEGPEEGRRARKAKREPGEEPRDPEARPSSEGSAVPTGDDAKAAMDAVAEMDAGPPEEGEPPPEKPWWQVANETGNKPSVTLADMTRDAGGSLEKRMAKGFFVAIDKTVGWNSRSFFRTTNGLLAPSDRMWINKPPESKGIDLPEGAKSVYFMLSDKGRLWEIDAAKKKAKDVGAAKRFAGYGLTGEVLKVDGTEFRETVSGKWVKSSNGTWTETGARPDQVGEAERWVDVNLDKKTLSLMIGDKAVYAALVSPGKRSRDRRKNHATKTGVWRIREKHVAVTMDGDGAGGDLPYSIDDVPFVAYYDGSYALHGAFWHSNFGREMSHGCVNLAPLDAKHVFDFAEPRVPVGWHAAYATKDHPGSVVSIH